MLVDAHLHLWDPVKLRYDWLDSEPRLRRRFGPENIDLGRYELDAAVFVQADCRDQQALDEVHWIQRVAEEHAFVRGIVAYAPVHQGDAAGPQLADLAAEPLVVGVRRLLQGRAAESLVHPDLLRGVALLAPLGLTFDVCVTSDQLPSVELLVVSCPETTFVLDHLGKPPVASGQLDPWRADIARVAANPNVFCKLSGLATEAAHGWQADDVRPYLEHALDVFGAARCMVGSDWPVLTLAGTTEQWFDVVTALAGELRPDERRALLRDTAVAVYRLELEQ